MCSKPKQNFLALVHQVFSISPIDYKLSTLIALAQSQDTALERAGFTSQQYCYRGNKKA